VFKAHVNPYFGKITYWDHWVGQFDLEDDKPVAQPVLFEDRHLDDAIFRNLPVLEKTVDAHVPDKEPVVAQSQPIIVDVAYRLEPPFSLETWISWLLSLFQMAEEGIKGFVQSAEGLLEGGVIAPGHVCVEEPGLLELAGLFSVANADITLAPGFPSLLESSVVNLAVDLQDSAKALVLLSFWIKTVFVAQNHFLSPLCLDESTSRWSKNLSIAFLRNVFEGRMCG